MEFSLVIPCYNEAANLPPLLERCQELANRPGIEIVLVDNGSTDDTPVVLKDLLPGCPCCRSIRLEQNQGYGFGVLSGLAATNSNILGWTHADMQTDPRDALRGLELFARYGDNIFVKGRRYGRPWLDVALTAGMSALETLLLARPLWDINAQPTMFSRKFRDSWSGALPHDFSLDLYAYYHARACGLTIHRFPVHFGGRASGVSHWKVNWSSEGSFIRKTIDFSVQLRKGTKT